MCQVSLVAKYIFFINENFGKKKMSESHTISPQNNPSIHVLVHAISNYYYHYYYSFY